MFLQQLHRSPLLRTGWDPLPSLRAMARCFVATITCQCAQPGCCGPVQLVDLESGTWTSMIWSSSHMHRRGSLSRRRDPWIEGGLRRLVGSRQVPVTTHSCLLLTCESFFNTRMTAIRQRCNQSGVSKMRLGVPQPGVVPFAGQCELGGGTGDDCGQVGAQQIGRFKQLCKGMSTRFSHLQVPQKNVAF